jgi:hypothetical protein
MNPLVRELRLFTNHLETFKINYVLIANPFYSVIVNKHSLEEKKVCCTQKRNQTSTMDMIGYCFLFLIKLRKPLPVIIDHS